MQPKEHATFNIPDPLFDPAGYADALLVMFNHQPFSGRAWSRSCADPPSHGRGHWFDPSSAHPRNPCSGGVPCTSGSSTTLPGARTVRVSLPIACSQA